MEVGGDVDIREQVAGVAEDVDADVALGHILHRLHQGPGAAAQNEALDPIGVHGGVAQRDGAAHRPAVHVRALDAETSRRALLAAYGARDLNRVGALAADRVLQLDAVDLDP